MCVCVCGGLRDELMGDWVGGCTCVYVDVGVWVAGWVWLCVFVFGKGCIRFNSNGISNILHMIKVALEYSEPFLTEPKLFRTH